MKRVLVTGCAGFIGSQLTESLLDDGAEVVGIDCFNNNYGRAAKLRNLERARDWDAFEFIPLDLARGDLQEIVADVEAIFHLAAEPGVRLSWGARFETYLRNNLLATHQLLDACRPWPEKRFVYASSSSVYGQAEGYPTSEDTIPRPFSPYGVTKLSAEQLCRSHYDNYGLQAVMLRYFSVYGPRQRPDMAFRRFMSAMLEGEPITVFGDGLQTRDFTFVSDVVAATRTAADADRAIGGVYNIGGGSRVSLRSVLGIIEDVSGRKLDVNYTGAEAGDVRDTGAATELARTELGFSAAVTLDEGLRRQFEWAVAERDRAAPAA